MASITKYVTYVSAYISLTETPYYNSHPEEWAPEPILDIIKTGVYLCLYISDECAHKPMFLSWEAQYANFRIMSYRPAYREMWIYRTVLANMESVNLPGSRNMEKDTLEYILYMHGRMELLEDAISENPWDTTHFAWIDFSIPRLFRQKSVSLYRLKEISETVFPADAIYFPGCWPKMPEEVVATLGKTIHWRFCGGFFLGSTGAFSELFDTYRTHFPEFLRICGCLSWEVNYWAYLEYLGVLPAGYKWYRGDHNDTILDILASVSADGYARPLSAIDSGITFSHIVDKLPAIEGYLAGSCSYYRDRTLDNSAEYLMVRYVNYWMYPNGYYRFPGTSLQIQNKNVLCKWVDGGPIHIATMPDELIGVNGAPLARPVREKPDFSIGLEDIRLYSGANGQLRFIATNVDFSPAGKNRMIVGDIQLLSVANDAANETVDTIYKNCIVVGSPDPNSWCEKNWIPIGPDLYGDTISFCVDANVDIQCKEVFIYKWSPMEIGYINGDGNLEIVVKHEVAPWIFSRIRGSTPFCPMETRPEWLVGLVHFSEEHTPRHYYNMLIVLERDTLKPVAYTDTFYFERLGVEFCIGMANRGGKYQFWVSRYDRDPILITVDSNSMEGTLKYII